MPFTRMDEGKVEDWMAIGTQVSLRQSTMPATIKSMLAQLEQQVDGFAVNQLVHGLQTATRAERAGASEELIVAALCHDIGKVISVENHPAIGAEILKPYVSHETYQIIRTHQDFQGRHYYALWGKTRTRGANTKMKHGTNRRLALPMSGTERRLIPLMTRCRWNISSR